MGRKGGRGGRAGSRTPSSPALIGRRASHRHGPPSRSAVQARGGPPTSTVSAGGGARGALARGGADSAVAMVREGKSSIAAAQTRGVRKITRSHQSRGCGARVGKRPAARSAAWQSDDRGRWAAGLAHAHRFHAFFGLAQPLVVFEVVEMREDPEDFREAVRLRARRASA